MSKLTAEEKSCQHNFKEHYFPRSCCMPIMQSILGFCITCFYNLGPVCQRSRFFGSFVRKKNREQCFPKSGLKPTVGEQNWATHTPLMGKV